MVEKDKTEEENNSSESTVPEDPQDNSSPDISNMNYETLREQIAQVKNIERVLDVKLEFTVKLGQLNMRLREILELNPGSILELDKNVDAPLNLQIGDKVLAKGEVVTIGENIGLRIVSK